MASDAPQMAEWEIMPGEGTNSPSVENPGSKIDVRVWSYVLAWPISVNHYKVPVVRGRRAMLILTEEARLWKALGEQEVARQRRAQGAPTLAGPVSVTVRLFRPRRRGDSDNSLKLTFDLLAAAGVIKDDEQIKEHHVYRDEDKERPRVEIEVREI